jgi:hypothetical protein
MSKQFDFDAPAEEEPRAVAQPAVKPAECEPQHRDVRIDSLPAQPEEEPIDLLRARLIDGWVATLQKQATRAGAKPASAEHIKANDSFCVWVDAQPEGALRHWLAQRDAIWSKPKPKQQEVQSAWRADAEKAMEVIFGLSNEATGRVPLDELLASNDYAALSDREKWVARYMVENYQKQRADGSWHIDNHADHGGVREDHYAGAMA